MKCLTLVSMTLAAAAIAFAGCAQHDKMDDMPGMHMAMANTPPVDTTGAVDLANTKCVVTGDDVGGSKLIAVYQGKVYHFCCPDCPPEFKKDPAKYAAAVAADPAKYGVKKGT